jgi:hypothetical protein
MKHLKVPMELRREIDDCVAMAQAATSNKLRAHHYATAQAYLHLYEAESRAEDTNQPFLLDKCVATATD